MNGTPVASGEPVFVTEALESANLTVTFPRGYIAADGFVQRITVSASSNEVEYPLEAGYALDAVPARIALPPDPQIMLTLTIGFCSIDEKDVCYIDRPEITIIRRQTASDAGGLELSFVPETRS